MFWTSNVVLAPSFPLATRKKKQVGKKLFRLKRLRLHKKQSQWKELTSTCESRFIFKRRRVRIFPPCLISFVLLPKLNHHLASNWKKVKIKQSKKIIVTRKKKGEQRERVSIALMPVVQEVTAAVVFAISHVSPLAYSLKHLQLIKMNTENSPGNGKKGSAMWIFITERVTRDEHGRRHFEK